MRVLTCIKQVPGSSQAEVDPETGIMKRDTVAGKMNPYDLYALEMAVSLVERYGGSVQTLTMGPPQAKAVIAESVCMGADSGVVLSDRRFAGADVLATAYTLAQGIRAMGPFDLILCGKQTTDGDTAQVGAEIAEYLGLPNVSNVRTIEDVEDGSVELTATLDETVVRMRVQTPCLLSVDGDINTPRLPSYRIQRSMTGDRVRLLTFADLPDADETHYGLSGSATQVERIFPPEKNTEKYTITGTPDEQADAIFSLLQRSKRLP